MPPIANRLLTALINTESHITCSYESGLSTAMAYSKSTVFPAILSILCIFHDPALRILMKLS
ncbi:hypothetical protein BIW11_09170 [Tropilaelaps mercedesae]|uniref:Uncharacterized protein n=1 Tax=Tropilaelaps mercedesae TaxID=418985 RepID=A0A1V9XL87_9ACAR|nr:hypothetical protein BIW11_09170 [Tropilaelaps mercedesae]